MDPSRWTFSLTLVLHQYVISFGRTGIRSSSYQCICIRPYSEKALFDVALVLAKIFLFVKHWKKLHNCHFFVQKAGYSIIVSQTIFARVHPDIHNYLLNTCTVSYFSRWAVSGQEYNKVYDKGTD